MDKNPHYDAEYLRWHSQFSDFAAWANITKFQAFIKENDTVLDFGCGSGILAIALTVSAGQSVARRRLCGDGAAGGRGRENSLFSTSSSVCYNYPQKPPVFINDFANGHLFYLTTNLGK